MKYCSKGAVIKISPYVLLRMTAGMAGSGNHNMNCFGWWWTVEMGNSTSLHVGLIDE